MPGLGLTPVLHSKRVRSSFSAAIERLAENLSRVYATYSAQDTTKASWIGPPSVLAFERQVATSALKDAMMPSVLLRWG